jgi:CRISPR-associated protein Csx14
MAERVFWEIQASTLVSGRFVQNMNQQILIATLGSEPQVVTLALDLLREKGYPIGEVLVVHTVGEAVRAALTVLAHEFALPGACRYRPVPVKSNDRVVGDIVTEEDTAALLRTIHKVVLAEKRAGKLIHLSIAGGRKPMAIYGMLVAHLLFDENDRVWHLLSERWKPGDKRVMHVQPGDPVWLVSIPVLRWSSVSPVFTKLALYEDPWEAIQAQQSIKQEEEWRWKREFVEHKLTPAECALIRFACQGLPNEAIAAQLGRSKKTVNNQFTRIYQKLHEWRGYRTDIPTTREVLIAEFAPYFAQERR